METIESIKKQVLELVGNRPGLRTVQIADGLDVDQESVEIALSQLHEEGQAVAHDVIAPNHLPASAWTLLGIGLDAVSQVSKKASQLDNYDDRVLKPTQVTRPASQATAPFPGASFLVVTGTHDDSEERPTRQAARAIAYLKKHTTATNDQIAEAMGITYSPTAALRRAARNGWVVRIGKNWNLGKTPIELTAEELVEASPSMPKAKAEPVTSPQPPINATDALISELLRTHLTPDEYRGFLKGNAVLHTLRAGQGKEHDYQQAAKYSQRLAESISNT